MNVPVANYVLTDKEEFVTTNEFGETALPYAPTIPTSNGRSVTPQQFLDVNRSLASVEAILAQIHVPEHFVLFAGEENGLVYLMCAIFGHENYIKRPEQSNEMKVVYGRRWLLEPSTPTSEVVQTALLAVKKAREHELRERVVLLVSGAMFPTEPNAVPRRTTPFNCHMDLPLMVQEAVKLEAMPSADWCAEELLGNMRVDNLQPYLQRRTSLPGGRVLFDIELKTSRKPASSFADLAGKQVSILCSKGTQAEFLHELFDALLVASDQFVGETVTFQRFARFSQTVCPMKVAEFSQKTRKITHCDSRFGEHFQDMSYRVDAVKAPAFNQGELGEIQRRTLADIERSYGAIAGYKPY